MKTIDALKALVTVIANSGLRTTEVSDEQLKSLAKDIEDSLFFEDQGNALIVNALWLLVPDACRVVGMWDESVCFMALPVLEAIAELSAGELSVDDMDGFDNEGTWKTTFKLNGRRESLTFKESEVANPKDLVEAIAASAVGIRHKTLRETYLVCFASSQIYDEAGGAVICRLPVEVAQQVRTLMSS